MDSETVVIVDLSCRPQPTRSARPRRPCGRTMSSRMRITSAEAYLRSPGAPNDRRQLDDQADDQRADQGAERRTETAERDRGEEQQQDLQPGVPAHAVLDDQGVEDPGQTGQRGRRRSTPAGSPCRRRCRRPRPGPGCRTPRGWPGRCGCAGGRSRRAAMTTIEITIAITSNSVVGDRSEGPRSRLVEHDLHRVGGDEVLVGVLQRQRQADGHDHHLRQAETAPSQRLPDDAVLGVAGEPAEDHDQHACRATG